MDRVARSLGVNVAKVAWAIGVARLGIYLVEANDNHTLRLVNWYKTERGKSKKLPDDQREAKITNAWNEVVEEFAEHGVYHLNLMAVKATMDITALCHCIPKWAIMFFNLLKLIKETLSNVTDLRSLTADMIKNVKNSVTALQAMVEDNPNALQRFLEVAQIILEVGPELRFREQFFDRLRAACEYTVIAVRGMVRGVASVVEDQVLTYTFQFLGAVKYFEKTFSASLRFLFEASVLTVN
jgi:hypothetical protein